MSGFFIIFFFKVKSKVFLHSRVATLAVAVKLRLLSYCPCVF